MANPNEPANKNHPDRDLVERIATEEAAVARVAVASVLGMSREGRATAARRRAFQRIVRETGCSAEGLAAVWGCWAGSITHALAQSPAARPGPEPGCSVYDKPTIAQLHARHGQERAALIIAGADLATNQDISNWQRLGLPKTGRAA